MFCSLLFFCLPYVLEIFPRQFTQACLIHFHCCLVAALWAHESVHTQPSLLTTRRLRSEHLCPRTLGPQVVRGDYLCVDALVPMGDSFLEEELLCQRG